MDWDKDFDYDNKAGIDGHSLKGENELISEKQELFNLRQKEIRCGKIIWSSIGFLVYVALYVYVILS